MFQQNCMYKLQMCKRTTGGVHANYQHTTLLANMAHCRCCCCWYFCWCRTFSARVKCCFRVLHIPRNLYSRAHIGVKNYGQLRLPLCSDVADNEDDDYTLTNVCALRRFRKLIPNHPQRITLHHLLQTLPISLRRRRRLFESGGAPSLS